MEGRSGPRKPLISDDATDDRHPEESGAYEPHYIDHCGCGSLDLSNHSPADQDVIKTVVEHSELSHIMAHVSECAGRIMDDEDYRRGVLALYEAAKSHPQCYSLSEVVAFERFLDDHGIIPE